MRNCSPSLCLGQESYEVTNDTRINQLLRSCTIRNQRQHYFGQEYCENTKTKRLNEIFINCSDCLQWGNAGHSALVKIVTKWQTIQDSINRLECVQQELKGCCGQEKTTLHKYKSTKI